MRVVQGIEGAAEQRRAGEAPARGLDAVGGAQEPVEVPTRDPREQGARFPAGAPGDRPRRAARPLLRSRARRSPARAPRAGRRDAPPLPGSELPSRDADQSSILPRRRSARGGSGVRRDAGARSLSPPSSRVRSAPPALRREQRPEPGRRSRASGRPRGSHAAGASCRALARARPERSGRSPPSTVREEPARPCSHASACAPAPANSITACRDEAWMASTTRASSDSNPVSFRFPRPASRLRRRARSIPHSFTFLHTEAHRGRMQRGVVHNPVAGR